MTCGRSTRRAALNVRLPSLSFSLFAPSSEPPTWTKLNGRPGDGLRHFACQKTQRFYNNVTLDDIHGPNKTNVNGIGAWAAQGIVGRGVLLDYHAWRLSKGVEIDKHSFFETNAIPLEDLKAVAEWQGVEIRFGDILFVRSGA